MPTIPTQGYEQHIGVPQGAPRTDVYRPAEIANTSKGLVALGGAVVDVMQKENQRRDQIDLMQYDQKLAALDQQKLLGDDQNPGALRQMGVNAQGITKITLADWDKQAKALMPKLRSPDAQLRADQLRTVRYQDNSEKLTNHEYEQGRVADEQTTKASIETYQNEATANADDPKAVAASLARIRNVSASWAVRNGMSKPAAALYIGQQESATLRSVIASQLSRNSQAALATFKTQSDLLLGDDRLAVESALKPYVQDDNNRAGAAALYHGGVPVVAAGTSTLYDAIHQVESGNRQYDHFGNPIMGSAPAAGGARSQGIGQMQPETAKATALAAGIPWQPELFNHKKDGSPLDAAATAYNIRLSNTHIDSLVTRFKGNVVAVAAAYNMGPEAAQAWVAGVPYKTQSGKQWTPHGPMDMSALPTETKNYIAKVTDRLGGMPNSASSAVPADPMAAVELAKNDALRRAYMLPTKEDRDGQAEEIRKLAGLDEERIQEQNRAAEAGKAQLIDVYNNTMAKFGDGVDVPLPERPTQESLVATFGAYEGDQKYQEMQTMARASPDAGRLKLATPEEAAQIINSYTPDPKSQDYVFDAKLHDALATSYKQAQDARNAAPAAYLMQNSPTVQASYAAVVAARQAVQDAPDAAKPMYVQAMQSRGQQFVKFMQAEQQRLGVPADKQEILPKDTINAIHDAFNAQMAKGDVQGAVNGLRGELLPYGDGAAPIATQIGKDQGMLVRLSLEVPPVDPRTIEQYAVASQQGDKELEAAVGTANYAAIKAQVQKSLAPLDASGSAEWGDYNDAAVKVAAVKMRNGIGDPVTAATQATDELLNKRYAWNLTQGVYRVPLQTPKGQPINTDAVMQGASRALSDMTIADFTPTDPLPPGVSMDEFKALRLARIQRLGVWRTTGDESGLALGYVDENGNTAPVLGKDGKPIVRTWAQLSQTRLAGTAWAQVQSAFMIGAGL